MNGYSYVKGFSFELKKKVGQNKEIVIRQMLDTDENIIK